MDWPWTSWSSLIVLLFKSVRMMLSYLLKQCVCVCTCVHVCRYMCACVLVCVWGGLWEDVLIRSIQLHP